MPAQVIACRFRSCCGVALLRAGAVEVVGVPVGRWWWCCCWWREEGEHPSTAGACRDRPQAQCHRECAANVSPRCRGRGPLRCGVAAASGATGPVGCRDADQLLQVVAAHVHVSLLVAPPPAARWSHRSADNSHGPHVRTLLLLSTHPNRRGVVETDRPSQNERHPHAQGSQAAHTRQQAPGGAEEEQEQQPWRRQAIWTSK